MFLTKGIKIASDSISVKRKFHLCELKSAILQLSSRFNHDYYITKTWIKLSA